MPISLPFTRAIVVKPLLVFLDSQGAPIHQLLQEAGITPAQLEESEALVPLHLVHRFVDAAARWTGIDNLGVVVGQQISAYDLGTFGQLLTRAVTVFDYLQTGARLISSVTSGERFWLTREGNLVRLHHFQPGKPGRGRCQSDLYALAVTVGMLRSFLGPRWKPQEVRLLAPGIELVGDEALFGDIDVHLNESHSSFTMPSWTLGLPINVALHQQNSAQGVMADLKPDIPAGFLESVEALIDSLLLGGNLDIETVAEAAGTSKRTLQRSLSAFGLSYSAVVEQTRVRMASNWLTGTEMPISDIADLLGYSDHAHFSRAFRRKSGISPQQYRKQNR